MELTLVSIHSRRKYLLLKDSALLPASSFTGLHISGLRGSKLSAPARDDPQKVPSVEVPALSLEELTEKTDSFGSKSLIGEGSYGRVYFATLDTGKSAAIKKLDVSNEPESNTEFLIQVCIFVLERHLY